MAVQIATSFPDRRHLTLEEYERMIEAGIFNEDARLELIRGEILEMTPPNFGHESAVANLNNLLVRKAGDVGLVWPQGNSIRLPNSDSRPQPDAAILRKRDDYSSSKPPVAEDVLLLVEVSDSTIKYDTSQKLELYAEAGIAEYWVVNVKNKSIEAYSGPIEGRYNSVKKVGKGETLNLPGGLAGTIAVDEIFR